MSITFWSVFFGVLLGLISYAVIDSVLDEIYYRMDKRRNRAWRDLIEDWEADDED